MRHALGVYEIYFPAKTQSLNNNTQVVTELLYICQVTLSLSSQFSTINKNIHLTLQTIYTSRTKNFEFKN